MAALEMALWQRRGTNLGGVIAHSDRGSQFTATRRLRDTLGDELLVRSQGGYQLTPRAARIQRQLAVILPSLESLLSDEAFDPGTAAQAFRLAGPDYTVTVLGSALFQRVFQQSPNSTLQFEAWHHEVFHDIERGVIDLIFHGGAAPPPLRSEHLFDDHFVCLLSREHPLAALATVIATAVAVVDCELVVLSGTMKIPSGAVAPLGALLARRMNLVQLPRVEVGILGETAGVLGAAATAFERAGMGDATREWPRASRHPVSAA
jgi:DNA-binding transcriptional LysR family regulator